MATIERTAYPRFPKRQGNQHELVERRKALRDLRGGLYAAYMKTR